MATWHVATTEKKNVFLQSIMQMPSEGIAAGKTFTMTEWYRWGDVTVESEDKPVQAEDPYNQPFCLDDYEVIDQNQDDGVSLDFEFGEDWTEEEISYVEGLWDEGGWGTFDENGIWIDDVCTEYYGPLEITEVEE